MSEGPPYQLTVLNFEVPPYLRQRMRNALHLIVEQSYHKGQNDGRAALEQEQLARASAAVV